MKNFLTFALAVLGLSAFAFAAEPPSDVVIFDHTKVDAAFLKGGPLLVNNSYKIQAGHREGPGNVEIHTADTDIFYILDGTATIVTGGQAVDAKETAPGELRADKTTGGATHQLTKGDVIVIPAGIPHWMTHVSKPFNYLVIKVTGAGAPPKG